MMMMMMMMMIQGQITFRHFVAILVLRARANRTEYLNRYRRMDFRSFEWQIAQRHRET